MNSARSSFGAQGKKNTPWRAYGFTSHTFTNAGVSGTVGPTLAQIQSAYSSALWASNTTYLNMSSQGYQDWKVPAKGYYTITAAGAKGGDQSYSGGNGAIMSGKFYLNGNDTIRILVGQRGLNGTGSNSDGAGGGGGGTFVYNVTSATWLLAAGGGGGGANSGAGQPGVTSVLGTSGPGAAPTIAGNAGDNGAQSGCCGCSGGAGYIQNSGAYGGWSTGATSYNNGGSGASKISGTGGNGGFGGGGSGAYGGGGGGGWSGGGAACGSPSYQGGGGGGSYNSGSSQVNTAGGNSGNGYVTIIRV